MAGRSSTEPVLIVPTVATTASGSTPTDRSAATAAARASTSMVKSSRTGMMRSEDSPSPSSSTDLRWQLCTSLEA